MTAYGALVATSQVRGETETGSAVAQVRYLVRLPGVTRGGSLQPLLESRIEPGQPEQVTCLWRSSSPASLPAVTLANTGGKPPAPLQLPVTTFGGLSWYQLVGQQREEHILACKNDVQLFTL